MWSRIQSGAEYLDENHLQYVRFKNLPDALDSLADRKSDAVVTSAPCNTRFQNATRAPRKFRKAFAPAYIATALPEHSPLKRPIDEALVKITSDPEWRSLEERFFGR